MGWPPTGWRRPPSAPVRYRHDGITPHPIKWISNCRYGCASCYHKPSLQLFFVGGYAAVIGYGMDVFALNTSTLSWREIKVVGEIPPGRVGHSATMIGPNIVLFGGGSSGVIYEDVWLLDTVRSRFLGRQKWTSLFSFNSHRITPIFLKLRFNKIITKLDLFFFF